MGKQGKQFRFFVIFFLTLIFCELAYIMGVLSSISGTLKGIAGL